MRLDRADSEAVADAPQRARGLEAAAGQSVVGVLAPGDAPSPRMSRGGSVALYSGRMEGRPATATLTTPSGNCGPSAKR